MAVGYGEECQEEVLAPCTSDLGPFSHWVCEMFGPNQKHNQIENNNELRNNLTVEMVACL